MRNKRLTQLLALQKDEANDPFLKYAIATEHLSGENFEEALNWFQKVLTEHPDYLATYYHYGKLLYEVGKEDNAEKILHKGVLVAQDAGNLKTKAEIEELIEDFFE